MYYSMYLVDFNGKPYVLFCYAKVTCAIVMETCQLFVGDSVIGRIVHHCNIDVIQASNPPKDGFALFEHSNFHVSQASSNGFCHRK